MKHPIRLVLAVLASASVFAAPQTPAKAPGLAPSDVASIATRLSGTWHFNKDLSSGTGDDSSDAAWNTWAANNGGGNARRGGRGGNGSGQPRGFTQSEQTREVHAVTDEATDTPAMLVITATSSSISITPSDADARVFAIRGAKERVDLGLSKVDVTTRWDAGALVQDFDAGKPIKLSESYAVSADGKQLTVTLIITRPKEQGGLSKPITRVYDR